MPFTRRTHVVALLSLLVTVACGQRSGGTTQPPPGGGNKGSTCADGTECRSGICSGGVCQDATACTEDGQCAAGQYCHFSSNALETQGNCDGPCTDDDSCGVVGQQCHDGRCSTNRDCNPANNSCDCPPGEVCSGQRVCRRTSLVTPCDAGKLCCYFKEQCPCNWVCDTGACRDPFVVGPGCTTDAECNTVAGCENNACECFDGGCRIIAECDPCNDAVTQCGAGNYCAGTVCRPATACPGGQDTCTPYGLVCSGGYCVNPKPCSGAANSCPNAGNCDAGYDCATNLNPPGCLPTNANECTRDELCPTGEYCELLTGTCEPGCRDNHDCAGVCGAGAVDGTACTQATESVCSSLVCDPSGFCSTCYCPASHQCSEGQVTTPGGSCTDDAGCPGGTICAYNDPANALTCDLFPVGDCSKSCRVICDLLMSQIMNTCPPGEECGGGGGLFETLIFEWFRSLFGDNTSSSASACYPVQ